MEMINAHLVNACEQIRLMTNLFRDLRDQTARAADAYTALLAAVTEDEGVPFICDCTCHLPMGFTLWPGQKPAPMMVPCDDCKADHP